MLGIEDNRFESVDEVVSKFNEFEKWFRRKFRGSSLPVGKKDPVLILKISYLPEEGMRCVGEREVTVDQVLGAVCLSSHRDSSVVL